MITWVIKASKFCNLRCSYCYEYESLGDKSRIPVSSYDKLYRIIDAIGRHFGDGHRICWHGGEPLLLQPDYYKEAISKQTDVFGKRSHNTVQTNLTVCAPQHLQLLSQFDYVSVSLDVIGGLRVNKSGTDSQATVLRNLDKLEKAKIQWGAISVLHRMNVAEVQAQFDFFNALKVNFRVLPIYRFASSEQRLSHELTPEEAKRALCKLADLWLHRSNGIQIAPLDGYFRVAVRNVFGRANRKRLSYSKHTKENVFVVDTSGDLYSVADTYDRRYCYGNVFHDSAENILRSVGRKTAIEDAEQRVERYCTQCKYFGDCTGWPVAEATQIERDACENTGSCAFASPLIRHFEEAIRKGRAVTLAQAIRDDDIQTDIEVEVA